MSTSTQLSGLVSGFDWKSFIDSTIEFQSAPITRMEKEQSVNSSKNTSLSTLDGKLSVLQSATAALGAATTFYSRSASISPTSSSWSASAATGAALGTYSFNVTQLATTSILRGTADISAGLAPTNDVSGTTLSTLPLGTALTAGVFTVNGKQVSVDLADSLQDVFDAISSATGGAVTASYDASADKVTLAGTGPIVLGAANDTSNFLSSLRLTNNGTSSVTSLSALGTLPQTAPLASAGLRSAVTAVDGSGNGSFAVNGVSISYNLSTDTLKTVLARITASSAGVTATYDSATDRVLLTNKTTGDTGVAVSESAGGLLGALGLSSGVLERGKNTLYSVNGGPEMVSAGTTLDASAHGIEGLSITAGAIGTESVTVSADTSGMKTKINAFISAYNDVQSFIDDQTKITSANGKVTTATLAGEREVGAWASTIRANAFNTVSGLSGAVTRLETLGIDFTSGTSQLAVKSSAKLDAALADTPDDVAAFFGTASTGFAARLTSALDLIGGNDFQKGYIATRQEKLTSENKSLDDQIAAVQRQLDQQRELLTSSFIAMETAQSSYNNIQTQLTKTFFSKTTS